MTGTTQFRLAGDNCREKKGHGELLQGRRWGALPDQQEAVKAKVSASPEWLESCLACQEEGVVRRHCTCTKWVPGWSRVACGL